MNVLQELRSIAAAATVSSKIDFIESLHTPIWGACKRIL